MFNSVAILPNVRDSWRRISSELLELAAHRPLTWRRASGEKLSRRPFLDCEIHSFEYC